MKITIGLKANKAHEMGFSEKFQIPFFDVIWGSLFTMSLTHPCRASIPARTAGSAFPTLRSRLMSDTDNRGRRLMASC